MLDPVGVPRCDIHNLAVDRDGLCIRCRKEVKRATDRADLRKARVPLILVSVAVLVGLGYLYFGPRPSKVRVEAPAAPARAVALEPDARTQWEQLGKAAAPATGKALPPRVRLEKDPVIGTVLPPRLSAEYLSMVRQAASKVSVEMFYATTCPVCTRARKWLADKNIPYVGYDLHRSRGAKERMRALNPRSTIPTFKVGNQLLEGFSTTAVCRAILTEANAKKPSP